GHILTVEDPIEFVHESQKCLINQREVGPHTLSFANAQRSAQREDPDIILVGEMRDLETTEIAFHAAMTGHLVLSTLHTNSAIATINRLLDLGVDPVLISSSITLITAQRLLRKLCNECKQPYDPPPGLLERLGGDPADGTTYYKAEGCNRCGGTGFSGRMAVHEMLPMNNTVREMIVRKASEYEIQAAMKAQGMRFLLERGMEKVRAGSTAISELFRVLQLDELEAVSLNQRCPHCKAAIESEFSVCPNCLTSLKTLCRRCNQQLKMDWKICPECRAPVGEEESIPLLSAGSGMDARAPLGAGAYIPMGVAAAAEPDMASAGFTSQETAPSKMPRILIVDDDPSIRTIVAKSLEQLPFAVGTELASNGVEAVDIASRDHPDLIVLDVMMPEMDGFEVCQKLRSQVETAFIPIMMLTANPSEEGRIRGYMVGSDDYVSKPFNVAELNARVTRLLRRAYGIS
ncbi:MAG: Flp pilus assembly complex ATPase component TadA, partial [Acidobacteria bacterium]|nr:Flp pilus assembly complex ATPase component TadA [Acidobacteriota bacterium]